MWPPRAGSFRKLYTLTHQVLREKKVPEARDGTPLALQVTAERLRNILLARREHHRDYAASAPGGPQNESALPGRRWSRRPATDGASTVGEAPGTGQLGNPDEARYMSEAEVTQRLGEILGRIPRNRTDGDLLSATVDRLRRNRVETCSQAEVALPELIQALDQMAQGAVAPRSNMVHRLSPRGPNGTQLGSQRVDALNLEPAGRPGLDRAVRPVPAVGLSAQDAPNLLATGSQPVEEVRDSTRQVFGMLGGMLTSMSCPPTAPLGPALPPFSSDDESATPGRFAPVAVPPRAESAPASEAPDQIVPDASSQEAPQAAPTPKSEEGGGDTSGDQDIWAALSRR